MFDISTFSNSITLTSFDVNVAGMFDAWIYTKSGSFVGFEEDSSAWTQIGTFSSQGAGIGNLTNIDFQDIHISEDSTTAFYVHYGLSMRVDHTYFNDPNLLSIENDDVRLDLGIGTRGVFFMTRLDTRIWSGAINYDVNTPVPQPPIASAGLDQAIIQVGTSVHLDGTQSYAPEGDPITYNWALISKPDGSNAEISDPTSPTPSFQADIHGDYLIKLVVSDLTSSSEPDEVIVSFENVVPVANATPNQSVVQGETACFDGSGSSDANLDPLSYSWTLTASPVGSTANIDEPSSTTPCITTDFIGSYEVSLTVNDGFVNSEPSTASVIAITYLDGTALALQEAVTSINGLDLSVFKNKNMQKTLTNKINAALELVDHGSYSEARDKLQNDLLGKTDGCATTGSPDKNDWIQDCGNQEQVYPLIMEAVGYLEGM